jgi:hypothetical protein
MLREAELAETTTRHGAIEERSARLKPRIVQEWVDAHHTEPIADAPALVARYRGWRMFRSIDRV